MKSYKRSMRIQLRRGLSAEWVTHDPTLILKEVGYELDTFKYKIGDGILPWSELPYEASVIPEIFTDFNMTYR